MFPKQRGWFRITDAHLHPHIKARMEQRGVAREELEWTLNEGWDATDALVLSAK